MGRTYSPIFFITNEGINTVEETWKPIKQHEGYFVSNLGNIRFKNNPNRKPVMQQGYQSIKIRGKSYRVHRLVAEAFCENDDPENKTIVHHKNSIRDDNRAENLEWCTYKQNTQYASKEGSLFKKLKLGDYEKIKEMYEEGYTLYQISEKFGIHRETVRHHLINMGVEIRRPGPRSMPSPIPGGEYELDRETILQMLKDMERWT